MSQPRVGVLSGVNGAGKTTSAHELLRVMRVPIFTNADTIARGLNSLNPESVAFPAGRVMLEWMNTLASERKDVAFETTLAARTYSKWLRGLKQQGYRVFLFYTWVAVQMSRWPAWQNEWLAAPITFLKRISPTLRPQRSQLSGDVLSACRSLGVVR